MEGYCPIPCRSGESAWNQLTLGVRPVAIVTDLALPMMSGRELVRSLRATDWGKTIPVLLLSGWQRIETFAGDADLVLPKLTETISIVRALDRLILRGARRTDRESSGGEPSQETSLVSSSA